MASDPAKAKSIFLQAIEKHEPAERTAFLDEACLDSPEIRRDVEVLLEAHAQAGAFLKHGAVAPGATIGQPITERPGTQIGPYKLLQEIGEGGMGVVYMAQQSEPVERRVALKIIKPGMDTRQVIARFEAERQALAMMDHPNIAHVLDVGTTDSGRPFFAMELVRGVPITQYCDEHQLTVRQRLELFADVCHAVQHAHQKGIIHRDIKPSNVLVAEYDDRAVPKIIDFGLAKAIQQRLTEKTMFTQMGQVVGTLEYMSPEQAKLNQLDIDTRSDIYSMGVLLYELLTGETPFDRKRLRSAAYEEILRILREEEPPRPSLKLSSSDSLPSIAANRHVEPKRLSVLVRGELDWIVMKAMEKDRARRYDTANAFASDIAHYLNDEAVAACPPSAAYRFRKFARRNTVPLAISGIAALVLMLVAVGSFIAAVRFEKLASDNAQLLTEKSELAENLQAALADSQANLTRAREQEQKAKENLALATSEQERAEGNLDLALAALDAVYLDAIGEEKLLGEPVAKPEESDFTHQPPPPLTELERELLTRGLDFYDQFAQQNAAAPRAFVQTAQAYYRVGLLQAGLGASAKAAEAYRGAVERFERLTKEEPKNAEHFRQLAQTYTGLADVVSDWPQAKKAFENARLAYSRAIELSPSDVSLYLRRGHVRWRLGDQLTVEDYEKALQLDPNNVRAQLKCSLFYAGGPALLRDQEKAREHARRAVALAPDDPQCHLLLGDLLTVRTSPPSKLGLVHYSRAIELAPDRGHSYSARGKYYSMTGDYQRALADLNRALELDPGHFHALGTRAGVYAGLGQFDKALADLATIKDALPNYAWGLYQSGEVHIAMGNWQAAADSLNRAVEIRPSYWVFYKRRARAYFNLGRHAEALADLRKALELNPPDTSTLVWIPASELDGAPEDFRQGLLELANEAIKRSTDPARALKDRAAIYLGLSEWKKGQADIEKALVLQTADHYAHYEHALVCLVMDDAAKYRESCRAMLDALAETEDPMAANFAAWTCALAPDAVDDYAPVLASATKAVEAQTDSDQFLKTLGAVLYRAGRHKEAIELLTELDRPLENSDAEASSSPAYTWYLLAMVHKKADNEEKAREYLNKANRKTDETFADEENSPAWNRRATLELLRNEAETLLAARDVDDEPSDQKGPQASRDMTLSLSGPYHWVLHCRRARRFAAEGNWAEAASAFSQATKLQPDDWELWKERGEVHEKLDQWDEAIADYQKAIELQPEEWPFWKVRAGALAQTEQRDKAIALYTKIIEHNSGIWELWQARAKAHFELKQWDEAIEDNSEAIGLAPENCEAWSQRGQAYCQLKQWDKAIEDYDKVIMLRPDVPAEALIRAQMLLLANRTEEYQEACATMLHHFGQSGQPGKMCEAARACLLSPNGAGDPTVPLELAKRAVAMRPKSHWMHYVLGMAHLRVGQYEEATEQFHESLELEPDGPVRHMSWFGLAMAHHQSGESDEARRWYDTGVDWMATHPEECEQVFQGWLEGQIRRREAEQLLGILPPAAAHRWRGPTNDEPQAEENVNSEP